MVGTYLRDTFDEIKDLLNDLNVILSANGLKEITQINDQFFQKTLPPLPFILVNMAGRKNVNVMDDDWEYTVEENVPVEFEVYVRDDQRNAILYEGLIKKFIKDQEITFRPLITDANLVVIHPEYSEIVQDTGFKNGDTFKITLRFLFKYSWT